MEDSRGTTNEPGVRSVNCERDLGIEYILM